MPPVYYVKNIPTEVVAERLVSAKTAAGARRYIAEKMLEVSKASPAKVHELAKAGAEIEQAAE